MSLRDIGAGSFKAIPVHSGLYDLSSRGVAYIVCDISSRGVASCRSSAPPTTSASAALRARPNASSARAARVRCAVCLVWLVLVHVGAKFGVVLLVALTTLFSEKVDNNREFCCILSATYDHGFFWKLEIRF